MFNANEYKKMLQTSSDIGDVEKVPLPVIGENQNYIFISYSHRDYKQVYSDMADMYDAGVRFWYDSGLTPGKDWDAMVEEKIRNPHCSGVIFYISKNLFISRAIRQEIEIATGRSAFTHRQLVEPKPYFSVNLTEKRPSSILWDISEEERNIYSINSRYIALLADTFSDESTYLTFSDKFHSKNLILAIRDSFNVVNDDSTQIPSGGSYSSVSHLGVNLDGNQRIRKVITYSNGDVYEGECINGIPNGYGVYKWADGDVYDGEYKDGKRTGHGVFKWKNGNVYDGEFIDGQLHGHGVYKYAEGVYEGEWKDGEKYGHGIVKYANGDVYEGEWKDDKANGCGVYKYANGDVYEGEWKDDKANGRGVYKWADGSVYESELKDGKWI